MRVLEAPGLTRGEPELVNRPVRALTPRSFTGSRLACLAWTKARCDSPAILRRCQSNTAIASISIIMSGCIRPVTPTDVTQGILPLLECFLKNSIRAEMHLLQN